MNKKVGIILVNYKDYARKYLDACRDSLYKQSYNNFQVYIVDNDSSEESVSYLKKSYPEAIVLEREDGNYSAANNLGFRKAIEDGCDYLVTANMDTEMDEDWLKELVVALDNNEYVGIAQSKVLLHPRNQEEKVNPKINSLGNKIHFLGFGFTSSYNDEDVKIKGYPKIKGYASGCSFIIKKEVFEKTGGYNETYYMYHDDMEISLKVKLIGYDIILVPKSVIYHKYEFKRSVKMIYYMERNRYLTAFTFYPFHILLLLAIPAILMSIGMLFFSIINGWSKSYLNVLAYFLNPLNWYRIVLERRRLREKSNILFFRIAKDFVGKIEFQEIANPILKYVVNPLLSVYWLVIKKII